MTEQTANRAVGQAQEGAQQWLGMLQTLVEQIQKQQQNSQQMIQEPEKASWSRSTARQAPLRKKDPF